MGEVNFPAANTVELPCAFNPVFVIYTHAKA